MARLQHQLDHFNEFAKQQLEQGIAGDSLMELFSAWQTRYEENEINSAIEQGLTDVQAGRTRPVADFLKEMTRKFDFESQQ